MAESKIKCSPMWTELLLNQTLTTTETNYTIASGHKISDFRFLLYQVGANAGDSRITALTPAVSGRAVYGQALHGTASSSASAYSVSGFRAQKASDTQITMSVSGSAAINCATVYGIK